jgi:ATP-dependent DNA ligase
MATRKGIQLAEPFSIKRLHNEGRLSTKWRPPYIVQPKLDGERCRALVTQGERCILLSSSEEIIASIPHINQAMLGFPTGEYDGELYVHGMNQSDIHSIVSRENNLHPNYGQMEYHIFDVCQEDYSQAERTFYIQNLNCFGGYIKKVDTFAVHTYEELLNFYDKFIGNGYEGFIVREINSLYLRRRSPYMMKFKPKKNDIYKIVAINEAVSESGKPLGMVGSFTCIDNMGTTFDVGAGKLTHPERVEIWRMRGFYAVKSRLLVEYQTISTKNKVPLFSRAVIVI